MKLNIKKYFTKKKNEDIVRLEVMNNNTNIHLIALARLLFIKPKDLKREVNNIKANTEYIEELIKLM